MENAVLNSWKEIATYTGRGIRTLQRWEQELGFPVRRPRGKQRSAVIAIKQEIDLWMHTPHGAEAKHKPHHIKLENHTRLLNNTEVLHLRASTLLSCSEVLAERVARAIALGSAMQTSCKTAPREQKTWATEIVSNSDSLKKNATRAKEPGSALQNSAHSPKRLAN